MSVVLLSVTILSFAGESLLAKEKRVGKQKRVRITSILQNVRITCCEFDSCVGAILQRRNCRDSRSEEITLRSRVD